MLRENDPRSRGPVQGLSPEPVRGRRARIGFLSKLFAEHEPHGLLLEGVVQHLPRDRFVVVVLPVASLGRDAASELLRSSADELIELGLNMRENRLTLIKAELDVLVFAGHAVGAHVLLPRLFAVRPRPGLLLGQPADDGAVFHRLLCVSGSHGAPSYRTLGWRRVVREQVVLLDGQGIWYRRPIIPEGLPYPDRGRLSPQGKRWVYLKGTGRCSYVPSPSSSCTPTSIL